MSLGTMEVHDVVVPIRSITLEQGKIRFHGHTHTDHDVIGTLCIRGADGLLVIITSQEVELESNIHAEFTYELDIDATHASGPVDYK